ncbi:MAG: hypothetical protein DRH24_20515 [Deltaproteobacteria bacterium]|nr:MAG: hypothetical protein DRH24_20515 [Deltaproteobacteria bacterium]
MFDLAVAYSRYKFLGNEFLTWLWFISEQDQEKLKTIEKDLAALNIGNRIVLENRLNNAVETITISGDDAGLEEGILALAKGAIVTEINVLYKTRDNEWRFTIRGESMNISNLKIPPTDLPESDEDIEGLVLEKVYLYEKALQLIDNLFNAFIQLRVSSKWNETEVPKIRKWISSQAKAF